MKEQSIDFFDPAIVMAFIMAAMGDFASLFLLGVLIPGIGFIVGAYILVAHLFASVIIGAFLVPQLKHILSKLLLGLGMAISVLLGLPTLMLGIGIALFTETRVGEFVVSEAIIVGIGALTGGAGAVAGEAIETTAATSGAAAAETGGAAAARGGTQAARGAAEGAKETQRLSPAAAYEQKPQTPLQKTPSTPTGEEGLTRGQKTGRKAQETVRDIRDRDLDINTSEETEEELADENPEPSEAV